MTSKNCFSIGTTGYFFNRDKYVRVDDIQPGGAGNNRAVGPTSVAGGNWPSLAIAGFSGADAVLYMGNGSAYFFKGRSFIRVDGIVVGGGGDHLVTEPTPIVTWVALQQAGFATIDAVLLMPNNVAYFFSGTNYIRVGNLQLGPSGSTLEVSSTAISKWASLLEAGFYSVDAIYSIGNGEAYFFSGSKYAWVGNIIVGQGGDTVKYTDQISTKWPSLNSFW